MGSDLPSVTPHPLIPFHLHSLRGPLHLQMALLFQPRLAQAPRAELG